MPTVDSSPVHPPTRPVSGVTRSGAGSQPPVGGTKLPQGTPSPGRGFSIQQKLLALILVLVVGVVALTTLYLHSHQVASLRRALTAKAETYGRLVSKQVESAVAFADQETAREVFESVAQDPDVESLTLFTSRGEVLRARGALDPRLTDKRGGVASLEVMDLEDTVAVVSPVVSLEGPRGTLVLELSARRLALEADAVQRKALLAGLVALLLGALGASWIARSLSRRLRAVADVATAVAAGDLNQKPADVGKSRDEIGTMAAAFNSMLEQLRALVEQIRSSAQHEQERLEALVRERTRELDARNADMRRVLDNVGQGFFTLDAGGHASRERSAIVKQWFGNWEDDETFIDVLKRVAPSSGTWFEMAWLALFEEILPLEVCLDQLPKRLAVGGREFSLAYRTIHGEAGNLERVLVVISDITADLLRARAENDEREVTRLFARIFSDRSGFLEFFDDAQNQVEHIVGRTFEDEERLKRALHTLKGNVSVQGIDSVAKLCHALEEEYEETGALSQPNLVSLQQRWLELANKVRGLMGSSQVKIEIDDLEYKQILDAIERGGSRREISRMVQAWRLEPTHARLSRIAEQAEALSKRLGKAPVEVHIEDNRVRLRPEQWAEFWSASVHLLRNAIDHGLETPEERLAAGKPAAGVITLRTQLDGDKFCIEFRDNGRGIDWDAVTVRAKALGLPTTTRADLVRALFKSGFSTRREATEVSGRGVGLAAVHDACSRLGGKAEVVSTPGQGTTFRFVWPSHVLNGNESNDQHPPSMAVGLRWASLPPGAE